MTELAAELQQMARRVEIDPHAQIEICLRLAAHHRRQMKNRRRLGIDGPLEHLAIGDVTRDLPDAGVGHARRSDDVDERDRIDSGGAAVGSAEDAALEQRFCQPSPEKPCSAGNDNIHEKWRPWRHVLNHPRPSSVRPAGRYSQPTHPA